jgi:hypothetical protein
MNLLIVITFDQRTTGLGTAGGTPNHRRADPGTPSVAAAGDWHQASGLATAVARLTSLDTLLRLMVCVTGRRKSL